MSLLPLIPRPPAEPGYFPSGLYPDWEAHQDQENNTPSTPFAYQFHKMTHTDLSHINELILLLT